MQPQYDVVIPYGPNERETLHLCVKAVKEFLPYRNIYLLAFEDISIEGCKTILESQFSFGIKDVAGILGANPRNGWYLQQLLKLYSPFVIFDLTENFLVVDSDTIFCSTPPAFFENGQIFFNYGDEYHSPYFTQMSRLHPSLHRPFPDKSGICHLMPFSRRYLRELFELVEGANTQKAPFWRIFLEAVDPRQVRDAGASEYETYFSFMMIHHPEISRLRQLAWANVGTFEGADPTLHYISCHWYLRSEKPN